MCAQRNRDPEATREAILDAAEEVFLENGFGATPISKIAKRAGITKSLIHHYFGSKEGLWHEVKMRRFNDYVEKQMELIQTGKPTIDLLVESLNVYFTFLKDNPQLMRILAWMFLESDKGETIELHQQLIAAGRQRVEEAQQAGIVRNDIDPRFILFVFIGLAQHWFQDKEHFIKDFGTQGLPEDIDSAYLEAIKQIFLGGLLPR